jgi:hypothetical protein
MAIVICSKSQTEEIALVQKTALSVFLGLFISPSVLSDWTLTGGVTNVYSHDGYHFVQTAITDAPCGTPGKFLWPTSDPDAKDMFAIALAALVSGRPVRVYFFGTNCSAGGQLVTHMMIGQ